MAAVADDVFHFGTRSEPVRDGGDETGRTRGVRNRETKAFVFGGLFPIHSDSQDPDRGRCGEVRQERGLERMEAMLFALDLINADDTLLPGVELGYDIRDTCNSETVGLDEALDLIITGSNLNIESCETVTSIGVNGTRNISVPTSGIVGAASSRVSVPVASLGRLFRMPQVSYASSSAVLKDRTRYEYFQRTISPDDLQASAMVDILLEFGWNYVSIIFSQDSYGAPGVDEFLTESTMKGICTDLQRGIPPSFTSAEYDKVVEELGQSRARVVIIFANQETVEQLFIRIYTNESLRSNFTWIASDAWARSIDLVHMFNETAAGLFGVAPLTEHVEEFEDYFSKLTIESNVRNDWFPEFYAAYAICTLDLSCNRTRNVTSFSHYQQGNYIPLVIDAIYTFAHALHGFLVDSCEPSNTAPFVWLRENSRCVGQTRELNGSSLLEYVRAVNFTTKLTNNPIQFDENGNVVHRRYEILNYQASRSDSGQLSYHFLSAGIWDSNSTQRLSLVNISELEFGVHANGSLRLGPQLSQCGGCGPGTYVRPIPGSCCSICEPCLGSNYSSRSLQTECGDCLKESKDREMWGNDPLAGSSSCVRVPETSASYNDIWAIPSLVLACIGLVCVILTAIVFGWFWMTAVVKSSGREQMVLLLVGISCSFILAFFYLAPPSIPICLVHRLGIWFCYSLMFAALTIKVQRVARIFHGIKKDLHYQPRLVSPFFQVTFTLLLVAGQMAIIVMSLVFIHPSVERTIREDNDDDLNLPEVVLTCTEEHIAVIIVSILYESALIIAATVLGIFSFKFPDNFNEAKYISFCSFALLIVWTGLLPTYFATQYRQEFQNAAISFFVILSGFAVLIFIFGPKLFIVIFQSSRNTTHFSTHRSPNAPKPPSSPGLQMQSRDYSHDGMCLFTHCFEIPHPMCSTAILMCESPGQCRICKICPWSRIVILPLYCLSRKWCSTYQSYSAHV